MNPKPKHWKNHFCQDQETKILFEFAKESLKKCIEIFNILYNIQLKSIVAAINCREMSPASKI